MQYQDQLVMTPGILISKGPASSGTTSPKVSHTQTLAPCGGGKYLSSERVRFYVSSEWVASREAALALKEYITWSLLRQGEGHKAWPSNSPFWSWTVHASWVGFGDGKDWLWTYMSNIRDGEAIAWWARMGDQIHLWRIVLRETGGMNFSSAILSSHSVHQSSCKFYVPLFVAKKVHFLKVSFLAMKLLSAWPLGLAPAHPGG